MASGFQGLQAYQEARNFRHRIFKLAKQLPAEEKFVLTSQMRRAALSVTNNIAEGHGNRSYKHTISYLYRSRGSVNELIDDMDACEHEGYFKKDHLDDLRQDADKVIRLINGYISHLRRKMREEQQKD